MLKNASGRYEVKDYDFDSRERFIAVEYEDDDWMTKYNIIDTRDVKPSSEEDK